MKTIKTLLVAASMGIATLGAASAVYAAGAPSEMPDGAMKHKKWSFNGPFGTYDKAAAQRGFQVYREVCASCHALDQLAFRHLAEKGAPFYNEDFPNPNDNPLIKGFAAEYEIADIDGDDGSAITRPGIPADKFPPVYANDIEAASVNGKPPPDLSVMVKARGGGADYLYSLLLGYEYDMPESMEGTVGVGSYYNPVMEGAVIAMPPQLVEGAIEYEDGTVATKQQMAYDVTQFLAWSADPKLEQRKRVGFGTMFYLGILTILLYLSYRQVWKDVEH